MPLIPFHQRGWLLASVSCMRSQPRWLVASLLKWWAQINAPTQAFYSSISISMMEKIKFNPMILKLHLGMSNNHDMALSHHLRIPRKRQGKKQHHAWFQWMIHCPNPFAIYILVSGILSISHSGVTPANIGEVRSGECDSLNEKLMLIIA